MEVVINGNKVDKGKIKNRNLTVFQVCSVVGIDIPCFCYHENLSIAGNCRMCLVEVNTSQKLIASCALPLLNKMFINTSSSRVKIARENVLEFLLINHPLDCPICDQGGECDLQDLSFLYGSDKGRFFELKKRSVFDKDWGPIIKTSMNRCIHCTRCVRFFSEVLMNRQIGMLGRGEVSEISTYIYKDIVHPLSGNVIDLCPVGALTAKSYSFNYRSWAVDSYDNIEVLSSCCDDVRLDIVNNEILRVLPLKN